MTKRSLDGTRSLPLQRGSNRLRDRHGKAEPRRPFRTAFALLREIGRALRRTRRQARRALMPTAIAGLLITLPLLGTAGAVVTPAFQSGIDPFGLNVPLSRSMYRP